MYPALLFGRIFFLRERGWKMEQKSLQNFVFKKWFDIIVIVTIAIALRSVKILISMF